MSQMVDTKIVELKFDNDNFATKVESTLDKLNQLNDDIRKVGNDKSLLKLGRNAKKVDISGISKGVDEASKGFSKMEIAGITAMANIANSVTNLGKRLVKSLISPLTSGVIKGGLARARNIEQATFSFEGQKISKSKGNETLSYYKEVMDAVLGTSYSYDVAARAASQFAASNVGVTKTTRELADGTKIEAKMLSGDMTKALLGVAGVASMTGRSFDEVSRVFTKVAGQNRVYAQDLNSISAMGLNAAAILANAMGKTEEEVRDLVSKGKVSFQEFSDAMSAAFGSHAKDSTLMFQGALDDVNAALARIGADFYGPALNAGRDILNSITPLVDAIHNKLQPALDGTGNIMDVASKKLSQYLDLLSYLIELYPDKNRDMTDWINEHMNAWTNLSDLYKRGNVQKAIDGLEKYTSKVKGMKGKGVNAEEMLGDYFNVASNAELLNKYLDNTDGKVDRILKRSKISAESLHKVITGMVDDGTIGFNTLTKAFHKYWSESELAMSVVHKDGTTLVDDFNAYLTSIIAADAPTERFTEHINTFFSIVNGGVSLVHSLSRILGGFADIFLTIAAHLKPLGNTLVQATAEFADFVVTMADWIANSKAFGAIIDAMVGSINKLFSVIHVGKIGEAILGGITKAFQFLSKVIETVMNGLATVAQTVNKVFGKFIDKIYEVITNADLMREIFNDIKKAGMTMIFLEIVGALTKPAVLLEHLVKNITDVGTSIKGVFDNIGAVFKSIAGLAGSFKKALDEVVNAIKRMQELLVATAILEIAFALAALAGALYLLSKIKVENVQDAVMPLLDFGAIVTSIIGIMAAVSKFSKGLFNHFVKSIQGVADAFKQFAIAILIMAGAMYLLSKIDPKQMILAGSIVEIMLWSLAAIAQWLAHDTSAGLFSIFKRDESAMVKGIHQLIFMAVAVSILAKALKQVASISDIDSMVTAFAVIEALMWSMFGIVKFLSDEKASKMAKGATTILAMAFAIRLMCKPIAELASIAAENSEGLWQSFAAITGLLAVIGVILKLLGEKGAIKGRQTMKAAESFVLMAASVKILASALSDLQYIDSDALAQAWLALAGALGGIFLALKYTDADGIKSIALAYIGMAAAIKIFAGVIMAFGNDAEDAAKGLGIVTGALFVLYAALRGFEKVKITSILKLLFSLAGAAVVAALFGAAIGVIGIGIGIFGMGLTTLATGMKDAQEVVPAIVVLLGGLAFAIGVLASVGLPAVGVMLALALAFLMLGGGMALMGQGLESIASAIQFLTSIRKELSTTATDIIKFIDGLIVLKDKAKDIGEALSSISEPLATMKTTIGSLADSMSDLDNKYVMMFDTVAKAFDTLNQSVTAMQNIDASVYTQIANAINEFVTQIQNVAQDSTAVADGALTISNSMSEISTVVSQAKDAFVEFDNEAATTLQTIGNAFDFFNKKTATAFTSVGDSIGSIAQPLADLLAIQDKLGGLSTKLDTFVQKIIDLKSKSSEIMFGAQAINGGFKLMAEGIERLNKAFAVLSNYDASIINTVADGLKKMGKGIQSLSGNAKQIEPLGDALAKFFEGLKNYGQVAKDIGNGVKDVSNALKSLVSSAKRAITVDTMKVSGTKIVNGIIKGIGDKQKDLNTKLGTVVDKAASKIQSKAHYNAFKSAGEYLVKGLIAGISNMQDELNAEVTKLEQAAERAVQAAAKMHSPSKVWAKMGEFLGVGLAVGIKNSTSTVESAATSLAKSSEGAVRSAIATISDALHEEMLTDPVIKPVVDLSNVNKSASYVASAFDGGSIGLGAVTASKLANSIGGNQNGSSVKELHSLSKKLDALTDTMNSRTLNVYNTIDGSSDPEAFADGLIRSFRLNARTV